MAGDTGDESSPNRTNNYAVNGTSKVEKKPLDDV